MIESWRITRRRHAASAFSGEGARRAGGRWNRPGTPLVYTAGSQSLAILEMLVGLEPEDFPGEVILLRVEIPGDVSRELVDPAALPAGWNLYPGPEVLQDLGDAWVRRGQTCVLVVPSALVPRERNYLLNPAHPDMARLRIARPEPFTFDPRLWKTTGTTPH